LGFGHLGYASLVVLGERSLLFTECRMIDCLQFILKKKIGIFKMSCASILPTISTLHYIYMHYITCIVVAYPSDFQCEKHQS
jgi:hypothetical protein